MTETTNPTIAEKLEQLLEDERKALLEGDFDRIETLLEEKEALAHGVEGQHLTEETLEPLRDGLRRNNELYNQALAGLRNVAARLTDVNTVRKSLNTYDSSGQAQVIDAPADKRLERRA